MMATKRSSRLRSSHHRCTIRVRLGGRVRTIPAPMLTSTARGRPVRRRSSGAGQLSVTADRHPGVGLRKPTSPGVSACPRDAPTWWHGHEQPLPSLFEQVRDHRDAVQQPVAKWGLEGGISLAPRINARNQAQTVLKGMAWVRKRNAGGLTGGGSTETSGRCASS